MYDALHGSLWRLYFLRGCCFHSHQCHCIVRPGSPINLLHLVHLVRLAFPIRERVELMYIFVHSNGNRMIVASSITQWYNVSSLSLRGLRKGWKLRNPRLKGGQVRRPKATAYARIMPLSNTTSTLRHFNSSFALSQTTPYKQCYKLRLHCGVVASSFQPRDLHSDPCSL